VTRRVNVVVFNLLYMVFKIWISRETIFGHKEAIVSHVRNGINEKKCIPRPIVADSSHKNPEVGTVVPKSAISYVGVFLLNNSELCAISMCKSPCKYNPLCKGKGVLISIL
jgi:hypothetical protein